MGFICQTCGNEIDREHAKWLKEWNNSSGYGFFYLSYLYGKDICRSKINS